MYPKRFRVLLVPYIFFIPATALFFIVGCNRAANHIPVLYSRTISATDTFMCPATNQLAAINYTFTNRAQNTPVTFWFKKLNAPNYHNAATMLASVIKPGMSEEEKALAIWHLVTVSGFSYTFDYNHRLPDHVDPLALVRFPYFLCGEKAGILTNLAILAGLPAHVVGLDGHLITEIKYNGRWHLLDADQGLLVKSPEGYAASAEELHLNPAWLQEKNTTFIPTGNFAGFGKYQTYLARYKPQWIDTSFAIHRYTYPNNSITLFAQDKVSFKLTRTPWWKRLLHKNYQYITSGILTRQLTSGQANLQTRGTTTMLNEKFPYYLTRLRVTSAKPMATRVYFETQNRLTQQTEKIYLGSLSNTESLEYVFDAPAQPQIYYNYRVVFENCDTGLLKHIQVEHEFEFNSITFQLNQSGPAIIETDSTTAHQILFQITR